ncbi:MAG: LPS export ABC transporter periplasmic protein LptC [Ignavibacteriae bacterium HGW-Ignavibacteriae-2]|jgi:LPS export ABC transporter protein LptC|nr:MAG: LPS export ABC transporter periplasmic protein LptC [Ignavibacteriae bacterium HGW-Ignavibacteriae-2]
MKILFHYITLNILLLLSLSFLFNGCTESKVKPQVDYTLEDENFPVQESWDSEIIFSENGDVKAILYSDHIRIFNEPREKLLTKVKIDFYDKNNKPASQLTSKKGRIDDITENMFAIDSVVAFNDSSKVKLETEELMWRKSDKKIVTDKFVKITTEDEIIEGYGFESDQLLRNYIVFDITYQTTAKKKN